MTFYQQIEPCARKGLFVPPPPARKANSSPLIPRATYDLSAPDRMRVHETQEAFLNALIAYEDGEASCQLRDRLAKADRESKCIRRAIFLMAALFILSLAGLSYCAFLLPQGFFNPTHLVTKSLSLLGLAALVSQFEFFGYLLWHRFGVNRLHKECRHRVLLLVESQLKPSPPQGLSFAISQEPGSSSASEPSSRQENTGKS